MAESQQSFASLILFLSSSLKKAKWIIVSSVFFYFVINCFAQLEQSRKNQYLWTEEQKLQITVHIWGEVNKPGQYIVPDGTDALELISIAGGPTEYSNLNRVRLTREYFYSESEYSEIEKSENQEVVKPRRGKVIYNINLNKYLNKKELEHIPILKPGDIVKVNKNNWYKFEFLVKILYQVAIVVAKPTTRQ